jgi:HAD superfamily hydrolase (TIGR01484 family)
MYNYNKYGEYMKNKLFVFDLDGTLLCRNKENSNLRKINTSASVAIRKLIKDNYHVILATGRHYTSSLEYIEELGIEKYIITSNGGVITDVNNSKPIFITEKFIDKKNINIFLELAKKHKVDFH